VASFSDGRIVNMDGEQIFEAATEAAVEAVSLVLDMGADRAEAVEVGRQAFREKAFELAGRGESRGLQTREYRNDLSTREG
jgi:hypothetical protein